LASLAFYLADAVISTEFSQVATAKCDAINYQLLLRLALLMEYRVAPSNLFLTAEWLFGGGLAGKAGLSRLGEGRSGICKFLVSFFLQRPIESVICN
jgi:hypothetical protein